MKEYDENKEEIKQTNEGSISSKLLQDLTNFKKEGCELYKQKKIEEAKAKFKQGFDLFEKESPKISKDSSNEEEYNEIQLLGKKILSNLALCYYKQGKYAEAIEYDIKLLTNYPRFGKSIVRLFKSYSKLNKVQQSVFYGELFLELDSETRDKFKDTQDKVKEEQLKLKQIQKEEKEKIKKDFGKYVFPCVILCLAVLGFYLLRKK